MTQHNDHPTLAMPGGHKLETLLVCVDGKCGRCVRCDYLDKSKQLVARGIATDMANGQLDRALVEHQALIQVLRLALGTMATAVQWEKPEEAKAAIQAWVDMTPAQAFEQLNKRGPSGEDGDVPAGEPQQEAPVAEPPAAPAEEQGQANHVAHHHKGEK